MDIDIKALKQLVKEREKLNLMLKEKLSENSMTLQQILLA